MSENQTKFGVLIKAGLAEVHQRELPKIGDNQVLVKHEACNICTTDYGQWMGLREHQPYPMAGGHEFAGIVVKKGPKVVGDFEAGDRVAVAYSFCGECDPCRHALTSECTQVTNEPTEDGYYGAFGFSEYSIRDGRVLIKMNKELSASEASFLEPLATVVKGLDKLRIKPLETIIVIGAGTMGLVNAQAAKAYGSRVIVTEVMPEKIEVAESMGLEVINVGACNPVEKVKELTDGKGADAVIIAVGANIANKQAFEMVKKYDARILYFAAGYPAPELKVDSNFIHYRKMELVGTYGADMKDFFTAANLLNKKMVDVSKLVQCTFPLSEIQEAYKAASTPGSYRVSVIL
jgi:L-iditol 2-dehydrogenase